MAIISNHIDFTKRQVTALNTMIRRMEIKNECEPGHTQVAAWVKVAVGKPQGFSIPLNDDQRRMLRWYCLSYTVEIAVRAALYDDDGDFVKPFQDHDDWLIELYDTTTQIQFLLSPL